MNLDELRSVQAKERQKDSLQHLRDSFYDDVAGYLNDLRAARDRRAAQVDNPFSDDDVRRLSDEIETAEEVAAAIYERRVGKVVKLASFAAAEMSVDVEGLTTEERRLFEDLVDRIRRNKSTVLDVLTGVTSDEAVDEQLSADPEMVDSVSDFDETTDATAGQTEPTKKRADSDGDTSEPTGDDRSDTERGHESTENSSPSGDSSGGRDPLADAMGSTDPGPADSDPESTSDSIGSPVNQANVTDSGADTNGDHERSPSEMATTVDPESAPPGVMDIENDSTAETESEAIQRTTVRITTDVGAILGIDEREYDLSTEDVVTLPEANATPLIERDAAERID